MNATQIMEMIEYHNNDDLISAFNNPDFEPHKGLRNHGYISKAVEYNNFTAFKALINNSKLKPDEIFDKRFITRIIKRVNFSESKENRMYLNELLNSEIKIEPYSLTIDKLKHDIFLELFDKIDKNDFSKLRRACSIEDDLENFKYVFTYLKENFQNEMTKNFIDDYFLIKAYQEKKIDVIDFIKNYGYDVSVINSKNPFYYIFDCLCRKDNDYLLIINYLIEQNITYTHDLISYINSVGVYSWKNIYIINFIMNNFIDLKKIFPNIGTVETNILYITLFHIFDKFSYVQPMSKTEFKTLTFVFENFKSVNPVSSFFGNNFSIYGPGHYIPKSELTKTFLLLLIHYNYEISDEDKKKICDKVKIDINSLTKENAIVLIEKFKKEDNKTKVTKGRKSKKDIVV